MEVKQIIAEIKEKMDQRGGLKHMYFVACGGSKAAIFPGTLPDPVGSKKFQCDNLYQQ